MYSSLTLSRTCQRSSPTPAARCAHTATATQPSVSHRQLAGTLLGLVLSLTAVQAAAAAAAAPALAAESRPARIKATAPQRSTGQRAIEVLGLAAEAQAASDSGEYSKVTSRASLADCTTRHVLTHRARVQALEAYQTIVSDFSDLALSQRAHVGRALMLFQLGQRAEALSELKSVEVRLRGNPEVRSSSCCLTGTPDRVLCCAMQLHAALAAMLYSQQPPALSRAEEQFEVASEFDRRFADPRWAQQERHWPPAVVAALQHFLDLS